MPDDYYDNPSSAQEPPIAISHIVRTLRAYLPVIGLSLGAVIVGYLILSVAIYLLSPAQAVTTLRFRMDFKGAEIGEYPNGTKFSSSEIITTPVLLKVYEANNLSRFTTFADFTKSIFVLESNMAHDALSMQYQGRLSDPKLSPIDRDRLQREYESKLASLSKDQYSINYLRPSKVKSMPDVMARKLLRDILNEWALFATREQHVLEYRMALLSPSAVADTATVSGVDPVIATQMLRANVTRVLSNIDRLRQIPAADLVRTKKEQLSLFDAATRLEDILRFRLDPLVENIAASSILTDRASTIRFLEAQRQYDERALAGQRAKMEAVRQALTLYVSGRAPTGDRNVSPTTPAPGVDPVMPQLSENFVDRMIQMTTNPADVNYRKDLTDDYQFEARIAVPLEQAVEYDIAVLEVLRRPASGASLTREAVDQQLAAARKEVRTIVLQVHEIYAGISRNMNPATQLYSVIGVPATRFERSTGIKKLALYGLLTCFIALPIIVVLCLLHNRIREEEASEASSTIRNEAHSTA